MSQIEAVYCAHPRDLASHWPSRLTRRCRAVRRSVHAQARVESCSTTFATSSPQDTGPDGDGLPLSQSARVCRGTGFFRRKRDGSSAAVSCLRCSRSITSREVFWDFPMKDLVWEWFGLLLWTSHLPKYQIQPWSHVKRPGWWLGTAISMFPWGLNCQQLYPLPLGPPDRLSSRLNIFRL